MELYSFLFPRGAGVAAGGSAGDEAAAQSQWAYDICKIQTAYGKPVQGRKMEHKRLELAHFNWRLWISLCALALIPAIYQTARTYLISSGADSGAFDIIGQMEWFDLINETLQAFLIVPLYAILNRAFGKERGEFAAAAFHTGIIYIVLYTLFSVGVLIYGTVLVRAMNPDEIDLTATVTYLRLETVAFMTGIAVSFANVVFVVIGRGRNVCLLLGIRTVLSLRAAFLLIPALGIYGVAVSNIITNTLLSAACICILYRQNAIRFCRFRRADGAMLWAWCRIGAFSGLQQFADNFIYAVMVCKMVNAVAEQGNYWIANNFIWGWLLIPVSALTEVIRSDCKEGYRRLNLCSYGFLIGASVVLWGFTIPAWLPFFRYVQGLENAEAIFGIVLRLLPFYIAYACSAAIDSLFVGLGKTGYNAVNSLIINLGYYGGFYVLYRTRVLTFSLNTVIVMFGCGMVTHLLISLVQLGHLHRATLSPVSMPDNGTAKPQ